jgi:N-acetylglucosaminyldiphosphoundecaprenol N-acetyl-beta-D-mannosaminyltransferase
MSRSGLEWLHRLLQDPRRLAHRYLVRDPRFAVVLARTLRTSRAQRAAG